MVRKATDASADLDRTTLIVRLRELIESLDSRMPHLEREGETRIADQAAALKDEALRRLAELETRKAP